MLASISLERRSRTLEFGIYRDGDNNLDEIQSIVIDQALRVSAKSPRVEFTVEDTGSDEYDIVTRCYRIDDGQERGERMTEPPGHDMSSRQNLAHFVARTLDNAEHCGAKETWIDLVDHGAGDGGGLEADHGLDPHQRTVMRLDDMGGAIADGVALHAKRHPEDGARRIDGIVANECLMATLGFSSALSRAGVRYLAASPETMLAPGVPTSVALDISAHAGDPLAMASSVVERVMTTRYFPSSRDGGWNPAAAFDVIDLDPKKTAAVESSVRTLDAALIDAAHDRSTRAAIREDARAIEGMVRFHQGETMPWRADRPAIALYRTFADDGRLPTQVRDAARDAARAISSTILAHRESDDFRPFDDADYADASGPTVHFPLTAEQIDPWSSQGIRETDNAFYKSVGGDALATAIA